jgi:hypothetical protein
MAALERHQFFIPEKIRKLVRNKYYDQIAFHDPGGRLRPTTKAGVFDFASSVFRDEDSQDYTKEMKRLVPRLYQRSGDHKKLYRQWRTFQMSDHCPLWIELQIDFASNYLVVRGGRRKARRDRKTGTTNAGPIIGRLRRLHAEN